VLPATGGHLDQLLFNALLEAIMHGTLLQASLATVAKDEDLLPFRCRAQLHFPAGEDFLPALIQYCCSNLRSMLLGVPRM
jgi:hypothetical protein